MVSFSGKILLTVMIVVLASVASSNAQDTLQWQLVSGDLPKTLGLKEPSQGHLVQMHFVDGMTGFISTHDGGVIRTDDGGITWRLLYEVDPKHGSYIFLDKNTWFSGPSPYRYIFGRTLDGGTSWQFSDDPCVDIHFSFLTADMGWL